MTDENIVRRFHALYYGRRPRAWMNTTWLGVPVHKCPLDLWIYQEILFETRPDVIVESGTSEGGSAYFFASMCDLIGSGRVITIDIKSQSDLPQHPKIAYLTGSSLAPETVNAVRESVRADETVMVVLDSNHHRDHVLGELRTYAPMVGQGHYVVVEDTHVGGNPVLPEFGPGPKVAVEEFLAEDETFFVDIAREKFFMTFNPGGYLKRVGQPPPAP
jgi:cephalosporin hydroxylase